MFRISQITCPVIRNLRPLASISSQNQSGQTVYHQANVNNNGARFYSSKDKDDKYRCKDDFKSKEKKDCRTIDPLKCRTRPLPNINECQRPNLMSDCPTPLCPEGKQGKPKKGTLLALALLAMAGTLAALYYMLSQRPAPGPKQPKKTKKKEPPKIVRNPANAKDIPDDVPYLLIGGGTAAFAAFRAIKSNDPKAKVLVISNEEEYPYMRPPLSKEMWFSEDQEMIKSLNFQQWNGTQRSLLYEPHDFYVNCKDLLVKENGGVAVARGWNITHLDVINKTAFLEEGHEIKYEKCLIATGSMPKSLDVFDSADSAVLEKTALYRTVTDFQHLKERIDNSQAVAVIGGGFLGSELACALARRTKVDQQFKVYQIFKEPAHMANILPEYLSFWTTEKVKSEGVDVLPNLEVMNATLDPEKKLLLLLSNGKKVHCDLAIVAVGAHPNTGMASQSDLEVDPEFGGYLVNTELQARSHLFVAGDAACFYDPVFGRRRIEHHDNAVISGRLAGENMTGAAKPYVHQSMFWSDLGPEIGYEAIGIVNASLPTVGVFAKRDSAHGDQEETDECANFEAEQESKERAQQASSKNKHKNVAKAPPGEDLSKGIIFYLKDDIIVGIVLWNVFNRISTARQVLKEQRKYEDLNEVAKLFNIHEE